MKNVDEQMENLDNANNGLNGENNNSKNNFSINVKVLSKFKALKIKSFFQQLHFMASKGKKKTPLHVMNAINIHNTCRSRDLIDCFYRFGLSVSYQEVRLQRKRLAAFIIHVNKNNKVPLPLFFEKNRDSKAMADNFDFVEQTSNVHESVLVMSQRRRRCRIKTPNISETPIKKFHYFDFKLPCQRIRFFKKPTGKIILPQNFGLNRAKNEVDKDSYKSSRIEDFIWMLGRRECSEKFDNRNENGCKQIIPTISAFNSKMYTDNRGIDDIRFLPVIPKPITEFSTVYTIMCNFNEMGKTIGQHGFPFICDEKVYCMARYIQFLRPQEFSNLVVLMGGFHITKNVLQICAKYMKGSGIDHIFIEGESLTPNVTEQILNGSHYYRSSEAFFVLGEALQRLQLECFYKELFTDKNYESEFGDIDLLIDYFSEKDYSAARALFNELKSQKNFKMFTDFRKFVDERRNQSESFKFWDNVLIIIQIIQDLIRADRTGNWKLHCETMTKLLPLYHVFDHIHYLRWGSIYVQDILNLENDFPELFIKFGEGYYTIKTSTTPNTSLAADLVLEKTANREKKVHQVKSDAQKINLTLQNMI